MGRGWLLLLCAVLLVWQPLTFAVEAASSLQTLGMRGPAGAIELIAHGVVAAVGIAAGWALWQSSPAGPMLARIAIAAAGLSVADRLDLEVVGQLLGELLRGEPGEARDEAVRRQDL